MQSSYRRLRFIAMILAGLCLMACAIEPSPQAGRSADRLSAEELRRVLTTNTLQRCGWQLLSRWRYRAEHRGDGTMTGKILAGTPAKTTLRAEGTWNVRPGGIYCRTWQNEWGGGKLGCFRVSRRDAMLIFDYEDGAPGDASRYVYRIDETCP